MTSVGAYAAKTHLPRLLEQVERGETITITRHGREVARLVPVDRQSKTPSEAIEAVRSARVGVRRDADSVHEMIEEGRRSIVLRLPDWPSPVVHGMDEAR